MKKLLVLLLSVIATMTSKMNGFSIGLCCFLNLYQVVETAKTDNPAKRANERGFALQ